MKSEPELVNKPVDGYPFPNKLPPNKEDPSPIFTFELSNRFCPFVTDPNNPDVDDWAYYFS